MRTATDLDALGDETLNNIVVPVLGGIPESSIILAKAVGELGELIAANGADRHFAEEAADVVIVLASYAAARGFSLNTAVERKRQINRSRTWTRGANGTVQHVEGKGPGSEPEWKRAMSASQRTDILDADERP